MALRAVFVMLKPIGSTCVCGYPLAGSMKYDARTGKTRDQLRIASPDRFALDAVVFDALGLTDEERLQVYRAVVELVKNRLVKARSV